MPITPQGVDGDPKAKAQYENDINKLLTDFQKWSVSKEIHKAILDTNKQLTIRPESMRPADSFDADKNYRGVNAATIPKDPAASMPSSVSPEGKDRDRQYAGKDDHEDDEDNPSDHDTRYDPVLNKKYRAKGGGSDVTIYFTPGATGDYKSCASGAGYCAANPDAILLHEMVHALRDMQGLWNPVPTSLRYKNEEEFLAIVVTNVYISKLKNNTFLRPDYRMTGPLPPPSNTTDGFLKDSEHTKILKYYASFWQPIFDQLGCVQTDFNPFSKFMTNPCPRKP